MSSTSTVPIFGLVDCNEFYVSCERVFQPRLVGRPVVVLSNNDGNVISRSADYVEYAFLRSVKVHIIQVMWE